MSPIDKISDIRRLPLLGTIRLGVKIEGKGTTYPQAVDYFVCPLEVQAIYGERPHELKIMFPADDLEQVAPQYYKCYSYSQGLICKGTGTESMRKVDITTGDFANRNTKQWVLTEAGCAPSSCPMIASKQCRRMMSLFFILYEVPGLGVYRLNTSSWHSIVNINSQLAKSEDPENVPDGFLRQFTRGRIAFIPLVLFLKEQPVTPMGEGRQTVHVLNVRADVKLADIIRISRQKPAEVLLPEIASSIGEEEPPDDLFPEEVLAGAEVIQEGEVSPEPAAAEAAPSPTKARRRKPSSAEPASGVSTDMPHAAAEQAFTPPEPEAVAEPEIEGLAIDMAEVNDALKRIHWTDDTWTSWISSKWPGTKVEGKLEDVLRRLTRDQAEEFIREVQDRADKVQPGLFD